MLSKFFGVVGFLGLFLGIFLPIYIYFSYFFEDTSFRNALYQTTSEYGFDLYHKGLSYKEVVLKIPERLWRSVDTPSLVIDIKFKNMQKIIQKPRMVLMRTFLLVL